MKPWDRIGPALGIVSWVVILSGLFIHLYPPEGASPQQLAGWVTSTDSNRFIAGIHVEDAGYPLLLLFLAWLCQHLWRTGGSPWLLGLGLTAATVWIGVGVAINGVWTAALEAGKAGIDPQSLAGIRDIAVYSFESTYLVEGLALFALGFGALSAESAPRWIGWTATAIGAGVAASGDLPSNIAGPIGLLVLVWSVAVAIRYLIRPPHVVLRAATA
jgi:hypothetical protein